MPLKQPSQGWGIIPPYFPFVLGMLSVPGLRGLRELHLLVHKEPPISCVILGVFELTEPTCSPIPYSGPSSGLLTLVLVSSSSSQEACGLGAQGHRAGGRCADEARERELTLAGGRGMPRSSSQHRKQVYVKGYAPGYVGGFPHSSSALLWVPQYPVCSQRSWRSLESCRWSPMPIWVSHGAFLLHAHLM